MKKQTQDFVDINQCLSQAQRIHHHLQDARRIDRRFYQAFKSLAGDAATGLIAYMIWRHRDNLISSNHQHK
jgi:hypothetical protein